MIPIDKIIPANLYSQDDATFLLGTGFTEEAARETLCEACRSGQLTAQQWRKRWWFSGAEFLAWVSRWYGSEVKIDKDADEEDPLARVLPLGQDRGSDPEPARRPGGR